MSCQGLSKNMLMIILLVALRANIMMMLEESQVGFKHNMSNMVPFSCLSMCLKDVHVVYSDIIVTLL